jgi:hypothetical protein
MECRSLANHPHEPGVSQRHRDGGAAGDLPKPKVAQSPKRAALFGLCPRLAAGLESTMIQSCNNYSSCTSWLSCGLARVPGPGAWLPAVGSPGLDCLGPRRWGFRRWKVRVVHFWARRAQTVCLSDPVSTPPPTAWKGVARFYDSVTVGHVEEAGWQVLIDGRALKTIGLRDLFVSARGRRASPRRRGQLTDPSAAPHPSRGSGDCGRVWASGRPHHSRIDPDLQPRVQRRGQLPRG